MDKERKIERDRDRNRNREREKERERERAEEDTPCSSLKTDETGWGRNTIYRFRMKKSKPKTVTSRSGRELKIILPKIDDFEYQ